MTALAPDIGYDAAARVLKRAVAENKTIREIVLAEGLLSEARLSEILDLSQLTRGGRAE